MRTQFDRVFEGGEPKCLFFIVCWYSASADSTNTAIFYNLTPVIGIFCLLNVVVDVLTSLILYAGGYGAEFGDALLYSKRLILTSISYGSSSPLCLINYVGFINCRTQLSGGRCMLFIT